MNGALLSAGGLLISISDDRARRFSRPSTALNVDGSPPSPTRRFFCVVLQRFSDVQPGCDIATTWLHVAKTSPGRRQDVNRTLPGRRRDAAISNVTDRQTDTWPQSVTDRLRYASKLPRISAKTNRFKNSFICCCLQQFAV